MARLQDLPTEVLIIIYSGVRDLKTACHLAACTRHLFTAWRGHRYLICDTILSSTLYGYTDAIKLVQAQQQQEEETGQPLQDDYVLRYRAMPPFLTSSQASLYANEKYATAVISLFLKSWLRDPDKDPVRHPPYMLEAEKERFYKSFYQTICFIVVNLRQRSAPLPSVRLARYFPVDASLLSFEA